MKKLYPKVGDIGIGKRRIIVYINKPLAFDLDNPGCTTQYTKGRGNWCLANESFSTIIDEEFFILV